MRGLRGRTDHRPTLLEALPTVVHLRGSEGRAPEWLVGLIRMIATLMASSRAGSEAVVTRLTDALLAQALRECLIDADRELGVTTAVSDPQIARSPRLIRDHPDRRWSVPQAGVREIARLTGYDSEVSVTKAFKRQFGMSPGAYRKANALSTSLPVASHPGAGRPGSPERI